MNVIHPALTATGRRIANWPIPMAACGLLLVSACQPPFPESAHVPVGGADCVEEESCRSFREVCHKLKNSDGFRQNVWLCGKMDVSAAICMDLDRRLYLVVRSERPARTANQIDESYKRLMVTPEALRSRMAPDAFILEGDSVDERLIGVFRIPDDARESFGIDLINHILDLDLKLEDQKFQWD